jgi:hypothetical protein
MKMLRSLIAVAMLCCATLANAQVSLPFGPNSTLGGPQFPSVVSPTLGPNGTSGASSGPVVDLNLATATYVGCTPATCLTVTRASNGYCADNNGLLNLFTSNVLRICNGTGLLIEEARTNLALWARDLTQSGTWIAVTMTAALNAVGADGSANSATTLTSTSPAGTILQSLTAASTAYTYTVLVKGVTVTGAIQVADYPALAPGFTTLSASNCTNPAGVGTAPATGQTSFLKCTVTATSLNPVIGFKFANSGDSIVVDFNQLEAASFGTSPILTTSASATRASDLVSLNGLAKSTVQGSSFSVVIQTGIAPQVGGILEGNLDDILRTVASTTLRSTFGATQLSATLGSGGYTTTTVKSGTSVASGARSLVANNGTVVSDTTSISANTSFVVGSFGSGSGFPNAYYPRLTLWSSKLADATLGAQTQ